MTPRLLALAFPHISSHSFGCFEICFASKASSRGTLKRSKFEMFSTTWYYTAGRCRDVCKKVPEKVLPAGKNTPIIVFPLRRKTTAEFVLSAAKRGAAQTSRVRQAAPRLIITLVWCNILI